MEVGDRLTVALMSDVSFGEDSETRLSSRLGGATGRGASLLGCLTMAGEVGA